MEEIRWIETPPCRSCVPQPEFRRRYACLGCEKLRPRPEKRRRKADHPTASAQRRYDPREAVRICAMRAAGRSYGEIAASLSLPRSTVQGIVARAARGNG